MSPARIDDCYAHLPRDKAYYARKKQAGLCTRGGCHALAAQGRKECQVHLEAANKRMTELYRRKKVEKLTGEANA